ncbi:MAG TPA: DNA polymerase IV [Clostridia bacterium]
MDKIILHSDLNNFYASVECKQNPSLRKKPLAVCGDPSLRHGIVLAKNYLAKAYGIKTGDVIWEARQKCPDLEIVVADFPKYLKYSELVHEIYREYTDHIENFGIDECWLDVTASKKLFGNGLTIAKTIKQRIKDELGLTVSIGVSWNKIYAKLGSDMKKPDAITEINRDNYKKLIFNLPAKELLYVGRATEHKLENLGIRTIGDIANSDRNFLKSSMGKWGEYLWDFANGYDRSFVCVEGDDPLVKSVGNSTTTIRDLKTEADIKMVIIVLAESIAARLREQGLKGKVISLCLQNTNMVSWSKQTKIKEPTSISKTIIDTAMNLFKFYNFNMPVRNVGLKVSELTYSQEIHQISFFKEENMSDKVQKLETTIDKIRHRFGYSSISRAFVIQDRILTGLNPKEENVIHPYSYF